MRKHLDKIFWFTAVLCFAAGIAVCQPSLAAAGDPFTPAAPAPNAQQLAAWLVCLFATAGGANQLFKLVDRFRGKPGQPPNEQLAESHNSLVVRMDRAEDSISALSEKLDHNTEILRREARERSDKLYKHIDLGKEALAKSVESMPERMLNMLSKIRDLGQAKN